MKVLLTGATGTIGQAVARELLAVGHDVFCATRPERDVRATVGTALRMDFSRPDQLETALRDNGIHAVVSCMASRSGAPSDAWAVDHGAHVALLNAAKKARVNRFVQLSAICVQKPLLAFQHAKLAFEEQLMASSLDWTIVRPTAYFKSLSGQVSRVREGKPFLVFGDGTLTACKPISDRDLARFIVVSLDSPHAVHKVLPIGGPGPALTPMDQVEILGDLMGKQPKVRHVPVAMMDAIVGRLSLVGRISAKFADKAEFARTGRYYATESMLVWDGQRQRYDADATPEFGNDTLRDHYAALLRGDVTVDLGAHAVF